MFFFLIYKLKGFEFQNFHSILLSVRTQKSPAEEIAWRFGVLQMCHYSTLSEYDTM